MSKEQTSVNVDFAKEIGSLKTWVRVIGMCNILTISYVFGIKPISAVFGLVLP